jgi:hypothetical protein
MRVCYLGFYEAETVRSNGAQMQHVDKLYLPDVFHCCSVPTNQQWSIEQQSRFPRQQINLLGEIK